MASRWTLHLHQCQVNWLWHKRLRVQTDHQCEAQLVRDGCRQVSSALSPSFPFGVHPPQVEPSTYYWFVLAPVVPTALPPKLRVNVALYL